MLTLLTVVLVDFAAVLYSRYNLLPSANMGKGASKLAPGTIQELHEQTGYTEREIMEWYKNFRKDCPSGVLTQQEFEAVYAQFFPRGDATRFSGHVFRTFDTDNDGTVNFREFLTGLSTVSRGSVDAKLQWAFNMYDMDHNGTITKDEMLEIVKAIFKMRGEEASADDTPERRTDYLFTKLDKNSDNQITMDEFVQGARTDPTIIDMLKGSR